jgi:GAF domain-containing protein
MGERTPEPGESSNELTSEQLAADTADLQASLAALASLVSDSQGLDVLLARVATYAANAIPGADGAGVTLLRLEGSAHRVEALAASHPFVAEIDEIQYVTFNEGPCITAAIEQRAVRTGSLADERMWPRFGPRVGHLGVHSALSLPLVLPPRETVGAINVYARGKDAFGEHAAHLGELFATPAAVAVHNAQLLTQARELAAQLQRALSTRPVIDQAIGLLRGRAGSTEEEAFARLRTISQNEHVKLAEVAQRIVDEAVRRARARNSAS